MWFICKHRDSAKFSLTRNTNCKIKGWAKLNISPHRSRVIIHPMKKKYFFYSFKISAFSMVYGPFYYFKDLTINYNTFNNIGISSSNVYQTTCHIMT